MDRNQLPKTMKVGVVIVTHQSESTIDPVIDALQKQTVPATEIFIIDSGSSNTAYVKKYNRKGVIELCLMPNIGFSAANNLGFASLGKEIDCVLFLNPDLILPVDFLEKAIFWLSNHPKVGALTPKLLGFDFKTNEPTGLIDSAGITGAWYGRWYDRGQGKKSHEYDREDQVDALCGACMFCRKEALLSVEISPGQVFDENFFCYKEDIDLSLRLAKEGWELMFVPSLIAYHGRGWKGRKNTSHLLRLMSAENELKLHLKQKNPIKIFYSWLKVWGVKVFDL